MISFVTRYIRQMRGADLDTGCKHEWIEDDLGHRHCSKCPKHQMLYENRYPEVGEPKYEWQ